MVLLVMFVCPVEKHDMNTKAQTTLAKTKRTRLLKELADDFILGSEAISDQEEATHGFYCTNHIKKTVNSHYFVPKTYPLPLIFNEIESAGSKDNQQSTIKYPQLTINI